VGRIKQNADLAWILHKHLLRRRKSFIYFVIRQLALAHVSTNTLRGQNNVFLAAETPYDASRRCL
jgi:hypothetical protein